MSDRSGEANYPDSELEPLNHLASRFLESRDPDVLRKANESNYRPSANFTATASDELRMELPPHDPVITAEAARALLRLIQRAVGRNA